MIALKKYSNFVNGERGGGGGGAQARLHIKTSVWYKKSLAMWRTPRTPGACLYASGKKEMSQTFVKRIP